MPQTTPPSAVAAGGCVAGSPFNILPLADINLRSASLPVPRYLIPNRPPNFYALQPTITVLRRASALRPFIRLPAAYTLPYSTMASASAAEGPSSRTQQAMLASQRAKEQGEDTTRRESRTLGYRETLSQWWAGLTPAVTEHRVLSFIPYLQSPPTQLQTGLKPASAPASAASSSNNLPSSESDVNLDIDAVTSTSPADPYGPRQWQSQLIKLPGKARFLNEFSVQRTGDPPQAPQHNLVMLHGYGAGLAFFYKQYEPLSRRPGWSLYSLDLLGMGRSSRPPFRIHAKDREGKITEAENWFIDALEEWRVARGLKTFTLLGHSLGGYMAVAYALKYPGRLDKLILASPVGVPEDPYAMAAEMPDPEDSAMAAEFTQDQNAIANGTATPPRNGGSRANEKAEPRRRPYSKWLTYLWDANVSPFSIVRWAGPLGPRLVSYWTTRRFSHLPPEEMQAMHDYSYSLFTQKGSGEFALSYVLAPGAFARSPLIRRIQGVGRQYLEPHQGPIPDPEPGSEGNGGGAMERKRENGIPVVFMYGDHDWMDVAGGFASEEKMKEEKRLALKGKSRDEKEKDNGSSRVVIILKAGHHLYIDNPEHFNEIVDQEMEDVEKRRTKAERWKGL